MDATVVQASIMFSDCDEKDVQKFDQVSSTLKIFCDETVLLFHHFYSQGACECLSHQSTSTDI